MGIDRFCEDLRRGHEAGNIKVSVPTNRQDEHDTHWVTKRAPTGRPCVRAG
jgi:hypothetical protein